MSAPALTAPLQPSAHAPLDAELHRIARPVLLGELDLGWPRVGETQVRVQAFAALGDLRAAEVDVELHFDCGAEPSIPSASPPHPMWSEAVTDDGWYRFAALVRKEEFDAATRLHVRVRARRDPVSAECLASGTLMLRRG